MAETGRCRSVDELSRKLRKNLTLGGRALRQLESFGPLGGLEIFLAAYTAAWKSWKSEFFATFEILRMLHL